MAISRELLDLLRQRFRLDWDGHHGVAHWSRVRLNGLRLAPLTGADAELVELFAFLHDSCREDEWSDPGHGPRAAAFVQELQGRHLHLDEVRLKLLTEAIAGHTSGRSHPDPTVATCWDADRLDLARVGTAPDPALLLTEAARRPDILDEANGRALAWLDAHRAT